MILRRQQDGMNNNGLTSNHKRDKTTTDIKMPPIGNKTKEGESTGLSLQPIATTSSVQIYDRESFQ